MKQLSSTALALALMGIVCACGGDDDGTSPGGAAGSSTGGSGGAGATGGTGGENLGGSGGGTPDTSSSFTAKGVGSIEGGKTVSVDLQKGDSIQVINGRDGQSAISFSRFEGLYASDLQLEKSYLGVEYSLLIDILDTEDTSLTPGQYNTLGGKGAVLMLRYEEGMWHTFHLVVDTANGDFVEIEEGSHDSNADEPVPHLKASYKLSFSSYTDMNATTVPATGSLTGRFDGFFTAHQDSSAEYAE